MTNELLKKILGAYMRHNEDMHDCYLEVLNDCGQLLKYVYFLEQAYRDMVNENVDTDDAFSECTEELDRTKEERNSLSEKSEKLEKEIELVSVFFAHVLLEYSLQNLERAVTIENEFNKLSDINVEIKPATHVFDSNICWLIGEEEHLIEYEEDIEKWH